MNYADFLELPGNKNSLASENTLRLWHHLYLWVLRHEYADTADSPEFINYVVEFRKLSVATIGKHLRSMSTAGLLKQHTLRRRLSGEAKEELLNPITNMFFGGSTLPSSFSRYCLPGKPCSKEFKSAQRSLQRIEERMQELRSKSAASQETPDN
jgi:hypothetical protein